MMTDPIAFALAVLALLATPGPTNTLLAASGATSGWQSSLRLVPAELTGYVLSIGLLLAVLGPAIAARPDVAAALKIVAAVWLAVSAVRLWREARTGFVETPAPVGPGRVFVTTCLNPKALVFALVIFPTAPASAVAASAAIFATLVVAVALAWIAAGVLVSRSGHRYATPRAVSRIAAVALAAFATLIAGSAIAGGL